MFYFSPERSRKILRGLFERSFKSTIIRPTTRLAIGGLILLVLIAALPTTEQFPELFVEYTPVGIAVFIAVGTVVYANLGFLLGWGIAHWRFRTRPRGIGPYWFGPAISGILAYSGLFAIIFSIESGSEAQKVAPNDAIIPVVSFLVASAFMGVLASLFFRYALNFTPLANGREASRAHCAKA